MNRKWRVPVTVLVYSLMTANASATIFSSLFSFGDSLSDGGSQPSAVISIFKLLGNNCDPLHPCPPYFEGHYSNGNVAVELLADKILPGGANSPDFHNFAVSGATSGIGNFGDGGTANAAGAFGLPAMAQEIALYLSSSGGVTDPNGLYVVWGGANDFLTGDSATFAAQNIADYVSTLAGAGAQHLLVPNLPDLSLTPFVNSVPGLAPLARAFSTTFNSELAVRLAALDSVFPAADIVQFDTFSLFNELFRNPAKFGFSNVQDACLASILQAPCSNPENYLSWDGFHPTTRVHGLFADAFATAVPEPSSLLLLVAGLPLVLLVPVRKYARQ